MNNKYELKRPDSHKKKKRLGCGTGSGRGKTSGRGQKGQMSRSGSKHYAWFEGGQMPLQRRIPKRGFNNKDYRKEYLVLNLGVINSLDSSEITPLILKDKGIIPNTSVLIKVLAKGDITKSVKIVADAFSKSAVEKIKKAGGDATVRKYSERMGKKIKES